MIARWARERPAATGLAVRMVLATALPALMDDGSLLRGVRYTDVDHDVYADAAALVRRGCDPYDRHTYRYTPFLAAALAATDRPWFGRTLFCVADTVCGVVVATVRRRRRRPGVDENDDAATLRDALWWLYNPLAINICTRGSAESFIVLLPVLLTLYVALTDDGPVLGRLQRKKGDVGLVVRAGLCGVVHGIAVHSKLYPVIYTPSYMAYFGCASCRRDRTSETSTKNTGVLSFVRRWARRVLRPAPALFLFVSAAVFVVTTWAGARWYGPRALDEGLLYHFSRLDHRHNYSFYWYPIYLARARNEVPAASFFVGDVGLENDEDDDVVNDWVLFLIRRGLFAPQILLLLGCSTGLASRGRDLPLALFLQTYLFVAFNRVVTGQYFTWYLCLLPLCAERLRTDGDRGRALRTAAAIVGVATLSWLGTAFRLEMTSAVDRNGDVGPHLLNWAASLAVFGAHLNMMRALLSSYDFGGEENEDDDVTTVVAGGVSTETKKQR